MIILIKEHRQAHINQLTNPHLHVCGMLCLLLLNVIKTELIQHCYFGKIQQNVTAKIIFCCVNYYEINYVTITTMLYQDIYNFMSQF
jgi:hypothetical protein